MLFFWLKINLPDHSRSIGGSTCSSWRKVGAVLAHRTAHQGVFCDDLDKSGYPLVNIQKAIENCHS